jgi:hypothetical protein
MVHGAVVVNALAYVLALARLPRIGLAVKLLIGFKGCGRLVKFLEGSPFSWLDHLLAHPACTRCLRILRA